MGELNLLTHSPNLTHVALEPFARYGWSYLYGQRVTTIPWIDVRVYFVFSLRMGSTVLWLTAVLQRNW